MRPVKQLIILFLFLSTGSALADIEIRRNGSYWATIESDGDIRIDGSYVGQVEDDGDVRKDGSYVVIEEDGDLRVNGSYLGVIESDGDIRRDGSWWGSARGMNGYEDMRKVAAVLIFFSGEF